MIHPLFAIVKESLPWFVGNTFALAAWWLISGLLCGVFLSLFVGPIKLLLTGSRQAHTPLERGLGVVAGAMIGMSGGATLGTIGEFSGVIGMVYLWGFVGMLTCAFQGPTQQESMQSRADGAVSLDSGQSEGPSATLIGLLLAGWSRLGRGVRSPDEWYGVAAGGLLGVVYGIITAIVVPLSATSAPGEELTGTISGAAAIWAVLGGFGGWVAAVRGGLYGGMMALLLGLLFGSSLGGVAALVGELFGEVILGALNGAIGGAFFGFVAAVELAQKRTF